MLFANDEHYNFFKEKISALKTDCYLKALIYTIGICPDTRKRWNSIYNEKSRTIDPGQLFQPWQTSGSEKVTRLAFNLFNDGTPTAYDNNEKQDFNECQNYSVSDIFCCEYAPFFVQAVKIRYPEYFQERAWSRNNNQSCEESETEALEY